MKIIYNDHEVGLTKTITKVIEILGEDRYKNIAKPCYCL